MQTQLEHMMFVRAEQPPEPVELEQVFASIEGRGTSCHELVARTATSKVYRVLTGAGAPALGLKVLRSCHQGQPEMRARFEHEAEVLASLDHKGFPRLLQSGRAGGRSYLLYRYVDGVSMRERLSGSGAGGLPTHEACLITLSLLDMFDYLQRGARPSVVHGDVSPENVILGDEGKIRLIDFGTAQRLDPAQRFDTRWVGKPSYLSPEQARGRAWDHRSDLYQLGLVFFELLTGRKRARPGPACDAPLRAVSPEPADFHGVAAPLRPVVERLTHLDPGRRYRDAAEARTALGHARSVLCE